MNVINLKGLKGNKCLGYIGHLNRGPDAIIFVIKDI